MCVHVTCMHVSLVARCIRFQIYRQYEPPDVGAETPTQVLCKISKGV